MNRIQRDYCSNNYHPQWKAWVARYDFTKIEWPWLGDYCTYCDQPIKTAIANPNWHLINLKRSLDTQEYYANLRALIKQKRG